MRLLLVEDSPRLQETIALGLRKAGYAVDVSNDGEDGLWRAREGTYDLVILDVLLPKLDGLSVLKKLRAEGRTTHVLMLTVQDHVNDRVAGLRAGADDYLTKPFAFDELLARVEALVRRRYEKKNPVIRLGDMELDTAARQLTCRGELIELTAREYRLFEFLARRAGEVVSRTEIEQHIYSDEKDLFSNAVESAISVIRKKLDAAGCPALIHTRRGLGYVMQV